MRLHVVSLRPIPLRLGMRLHVVSLRPIPLSLGMRLHVMSLRPIPLLRLHVVSLRPIPLLRLHVVRVAMTTVGMQPATCVFRNLLSVFAFWQLWLPRYWEVNSGIPLRNRG